MVCNFSVKHFNRTYFYIYIGSTIIFPRSIFWHYKKAIDNAIFMVFWCINGHCKIARWISFCISNFFNRLSLDKVLLR